MDRIGLSNVVACRQGLVVPAVTKGNGKKRIAPTDDILSRGHGWALRGSIAITIDDTHATGRRTGATDQEDTERNANHQPLKTC